jgi:hypothetical protein
VIAISPPGDTARITAPLADMANVCHSLTGDPVKFQVTPELVEMKIPELLGYTPPAARICPSADEATPPQYCCGTLLVCQSNPELVEV